jgi:hypothetical protein
MMWRADGAGESGLGKNGAMVPGWRWAVYAVLSVVVLAPVFAVRVPVLGDYLNHLARISILGRIGASPVLQEYYETAWKFVPYYGMDVPVRALALFMPVYAAGRFFVAACVLMPVAACAVLRRAVYGRAGLMPVLAFLVCYNYTLNRGFLNYLFSAGFAIMLFAGWISARHWGRWWRSLVFGAAALVLYAAHPFAFLVYGMLVGCYEINQAFLADGIRIDRHFAALAAAALQAVPAVAVVGWFGLGVHSAAGVPETVYGSFTERLAALTSPLYFPGNSGVVAACLLVPLAGVLLLPLLRVARGFGFGLGVMVVAACCIPTVLSNAWGADLRLPLLVIVVALACVSPVRPVRGGALYAILAVVAALVSARAADVFSTLHGLDLQVAEIRAVVAAVPAGARLLVAEAADDAPGRIAPAVSTSHIGMVAAIDRDVFVPMLFTDVVPIEVRPAYRRSASANVSPVTVAQLWSGVTERDGAGVQPPYGYGGHVYWRDWPHKFDSVLFLHFGDHGVRLPGVLVRVAGSGVADLYRIGGADMGDHGAR